MNNDIKGFTLFEVLVSVALLAVLVLGASGVLTTGSIIYIKERTLLTMQGQVRNALDRIVREARAASSQTITSNFNNTTNDKILIISPTTPSPGVTYNLSGTNLVRSYNGVTNNVASNINLLKFTLSGSLLQIQTTASQALYSGTTSFSLIEKVRLRNQ